MKLQRENMCPLIGEECMQLKCAWFTHIQGNNPQTGMDVDEWGCAVTWLPMLMIENSQQQRQTAAAVESARNENVRDNEENRELIKKVVSNMLQSPISPIMVETVDEPINKLEGTKEE
tara:strand:+ start:1132 stop:1485 length:354 start_codon:yes stop_codon:yes gene_type:complete